MSKNCHYFSRPTMARRMCRDWHKQPGCHRQPFFNLPLDHVVVDELHLMLRVTDHLEEGLIMDIIKWDEVQNMSLISFFHVIGPLTKFCSTKQESQSCTRQSTAKLLLEIKSQTIVTHLLQLHNLSLNNHSFPILNLTLQFENILSYS